MRHFAFFLAACASSTASTPPPVPQAPKPHVVQVAANALSCEKTSTRLKLLDGWRADLSDAAGTVTLTRSDCRAVLVARAGLREDRGTDFDEAWLKAETRARELPTPLAWKDDEAARSDTREEAAKNGTASVRFNGLVIEYAIDEMASLTCSFFIVGEARCFAEPVFAELERAPRALRALDPKAEGAPLRNMGPSNQNAVHDPANLAPGMRP